MGVKRPSASERRLEHLRSVRDEYYTPSTEEVLAQKDARIRELSAEVARLRDLLLPKKDRPHPDVDPAERRNFDFYRD